MLLCGRQEGWPTGGFQLGEAIGVDAFEVFEEEVARVEGWGKERTMAKFESYEDTRRGRMYEDDQCQEERLCDNAYFITFSRALAAEADAGTLKATCSREYISTVCLQRLQLEAV